MLSDILENAHIRHAAALALGSATLFFSEPAWSNAPCLGSLPIVAEKERGRAAAGTDVHTFYRLIFSKPDNTSNPSGLSPLPPKSAQEISSGNILRAQLELEWKCHFLAMGGTYSSQWGDMLNRKGDFSEKSFVPNSHEAIDIFVRNEGENVYAPFNAVVIAAGYGWEGKCCRKNMVYSWNGKGLTPKAGNGVVLFDPWRKGYMWISHLDKVAVQPGTIISQGQYIGTVGHSGNASRRGGGNHIHVAYKIPSEDGTLTGMNFAHLLSERKNYASVGR